MSAARDARRPGRLLPPPGESTRLYCRLHPSRMHLLRYALEAEDHLGLLTVVDRRAAVAQIRFSPHQEKEMLAFLDSLREVLPLALLPVPCSGSGKIPPSPFFYDANPSGT